MKKIGIKKTWGNIIMLFVIGMVIGAVIGLRQPMPTPTVADDAKTANVTEPSENKNVQSVETDAVEISETNADMPFAVACDANDSACEVPMN